MLADRLKTLVPSATLAMIAKARAMRALGVDVISFSVGEPDFDTPARIKEAAVRALEKGHTFPLDEVVKTLCAGAKSGDRRNMPHGGSRCANWEASASRRRQRST